MKHQSEAPRVVSSISEQHRMLGLPKPHHPLISVFRFEDIKHPTGDAYKNFVLDFYCIAVKKNFTGKLKYGQQYYDFDEGVMSFISPRQVLSLVEGESATEGYTVAFHPDLIAGYALAKKIRQYGFFSYSLKEALHLSDSEEMMIDNLINSIGQELRTNIDHFSQDIIISQLELLLNYSNRFYQRQFITRRSSNSEVLIRLDEVLSDLLDADGNGLPTVQQVAANMNISPAYLSDMLRTLTGLNTQQHIHAKLIDKAKELLSTTSLSVSELAYELGFGYPQSFSKFFKRETELSPGEWREKFR